MGKSAGAAPATPDPEKLIGTQAGYDKSAFNYQTDASRYNQYGPDSNTTWKKNQVFDQAGFDTATADWNKGNTQGTWIPGTPAGGRMEGSGDNLTWVETPATEGRWEGATTNNNPAPTRDMFTSNTWDQITELSPEQQKLHDLNQSSATGQASLLDALTERLKGTYGSAVDYSGVPGLKSDIGSANLKNPTETAVKRGGITADPNIGGYEKMLAGLDPMAFNQQAGDAVYNQQKRYADEGFKSDQSAMEARLAEQGFVPGTPGYEKAMNQFQDNKNQSIADMRDRATTQGFSVGNQTFGNKQSSLNSAIAAAMQGAGFKNTAQNQDFSQQSQLADRSRQMGLDANTVSQQLFNNTKENAAFNNTSRSQAIAELLQQRAQPLNELNSLRQGTQQNATQANNGQASTPNMAPVDAIGAYGKQYQSLMDKYNADVQGANADNQTAASIASIIAMMAMSDKRLKSDIVHTGFTEAGTKTYDYTMDGDRTNGVMAQELLENGNSDAVFIEPESGYYMVDYSKVR